MNRRLRLLDTNCKRWGVENNRFLTDPRKALMIEYFKVHKISALDKIFQCEDLN